MPEPKNSNQNSTLSIIIPSVMDARNLPEFGTSTQGHCGALTMCGYPDQSFVNLLRQGMTVNFLCEITDINFNLGTGSMTTPVSNLESGMITFTFKNGGVIRVTRDQQEALIYTHSGDETTFTSHQLLDLLMPTSTTEDLVENTTNGTQILGDSSDNI